MIAATGKVVLAGLLASLLLVPLFGAKSDLHSASNTQFEIVGLDRRSVSYIDDLSRHIVEVAARYLDHSALQFPQRILVSLKPTQYVDFEGDYTVRFGERGFVNLDIRWEEPLSMLTTCRALSEALLVRYSIYNYGKTASAVLPKWPATAIGTKAYLNLRPSQSRRLNAWAKLSSTPTVTMLLQRKWNDSVADVNGFLFLLALEQSGVERRRVKSLMAQSLAGKNIAPSLETLLLSNSPTAERLGLDDWWRAAFEQLLTTEQEPIETMEASLFWIETLANFSNVESENLNLSRLWDEREDKAIRDLIKARYEILKLRIVRVNPAYFNAARSLGALFETYLSGEKRHKYIFRLSVFLGDFEDGKDVQNKVAEALNRGKR